MNILTISDLHTFKPRCLDIIRDKAKLIDAIVLLGDVSESYFINLKESFTDVKIIGVLGNHDYPLVFSRYDYIENVHGKVTEVNGIKIGGIQGSYKYKEGDYPSLNHHESVITAFCIGEADILISHTSPYKIHEKDCDVHSGLIGINGYIEKWKPKLHLHGHQHENLKSQLGETVILGIYGAAIVDTDSCTSDILFEY